MRQKEEEEEEEEEGDRQDREGEGQWHKVRRTPQLAQVVQQLSMLAAPMGTIMENNVCQCTVVFFHKDTPDTACYCTKLPQGNCIIISLSQQCLQLLRSSRKISVQVNSRCMLYHYH